MTATEIFPPTKNQNKNESMKTLTKTINWKVSKADAAIIHKIAKRAIDEAEKIGASGSLMNWEMDLTACHLNGNPLDLQKLLDFPRFDFCHDVFGIRGHIDRETGELQNCFSPRCSQPETVLAGS